MTIAPTLELADALERRWDAIVVGAGPAGALAARELARRGAGVLLVDRASFPRSKVCGACLNPWTLAILAQVGLGGLTRSLAAIDLQSMRLIAWRRQALVSLKGSVVLSRDVLDAALVLSAIEAGAHFLPNTLARLGNIDANAREVFLRRQGDERPALARVVLAADGLAGTCRTGDRRLRTFADPTSRLGAGAVLEDRSADYGAGTVTMGCATGGYVGLVRLEDGRLNVAAALDPNAVKRHGGIGQAAAAILAEAGLHPLRDMTSSAWHGTPLLTRRPASVAAERVFLLGDAAGYVEPFTGEGIAWALASAAAVAPLADRARHRWTADLMLQWSLLHRNTIARRQWACRALAFLLRQPTLMGAAVLGLAWAPALFAPVLDYWRLAQGTLP